jgi:hypothetical protein
MNTGTTRNVMLGLTVAATLAAAGCAGESATSRRAGEPAASRRGDTAPAYQEAFDRAAASIADAEREGANQHGGADLTRAREKLNSARRLADDGDLEAAQRMALEASLDADVAAATERNATAQAAVNELNESIQTLQDELQRNEQRSSSERL